MGIRLRICHAILFLALLCFSTPAESQTTWFKYEGNPVLDVGAPGSWDCDYAAPTRVIFEDSMFVMWYTGWGPDFHQIGRATSRDGINWRKDPRNPVLKVDHGSWDSLQVVLSYVASKSPGYEMWYTGGDRVSFARIGHAKSIDGIRWMKSPSAILRNGPAAWDAGSVAAPSLLSDPGTQSKMWYTGFDASFSRTVIGLAVSTNTTAWEKHPAPVLQPGPSGEWDDGRVQSPRVLRRGVGYEMWYAGTKTDHRRFQTGYAVSSDGILWNKSPENPVLRCGPEGAWDDDAAFIGDVLFDGRMYYMWYVGHDGSDFRTGLAASAPSIRWSIVPASSFIQPRTGAVRLLVHVADPAGLSFTGIIRTPLREEYRPNIDGTGALRTEAEIELLDDGQHGDGDVSDGVFANTWSSSAERFYLVDLRMTVRRERISAFVLTGVGAFTTIGPVSVDSVLLLSHGEPVPGDTVSFKLALLNRAASAPVRELSISVSSSSPFVRDITGAPPSYKVLFPSIPCLPDRPFRIAIDPECPTDTDIRLEAIVAASGAELWRDSFTVHVHPPWWNTSWAHLLYGALALMALYALRRLEISRTLRKRKWEQDRILIDKLQELDRLRSRFLANISHEFRTPLTLIQGPAQQILQGDPQQKAHANLIIRHSRRLLDLVNQLLDLSKLESGEMRPHSRHTDLADQTRMIAAGFESMSKEHEIEFTVDLPSVPVPGHLDPDQVEKIVTNLLSNAFKFTPRGGTVSLSLSMSPSNVADTAVLTVSDSGPGIAPDERTRIFDRFYQGRASIMNAREGTGIGLALTRELVELNGGSITVESGSSRGSVFTVTFPTVSLPRVATAYPHGRGDPQGPGRLDDANHRPGDGPSETQTPAKRAVIVAHEPEDKPILLLIEDNADLRRYMTASMEDHYTILQAVEGAEGVRRTLETIPDLIVCDVMMPELDGYEVCRRLKANPTTSHIPIILLTAKAASENRIEGLEIGADDYLVKPFDLQELLVRIRNLIDQRRELRERYQSEFVLQPQRVILHSAEGRFLKKVSSLIEARLAEPTFDSSTLARELAMSRMQLHRKLTALVNLGPGELIRSFRMRRAADLLAIKAGNITEIAYEVGYSNPSHFAQAFKEQFGFPPSEYNHGRQSKRG